jgi:hypothetical protein
MTTLTLALTADNPADIADLVKQALDHDRGEQSVSVTSDGDITIAVRIGRTLRPVVQACDHPVVQACDHPADLPDPVHCQMLAGHTGPHQAHGLTFDDDGAVHAVDQPVSPHDETPAPAEPEPEPEPRPVDGSADGPPADRPVTIRDQVQQLLDANPTRTFTLAQVFEHIDDTTEGSIGQVLKKLTDAGRIRRVARGQYQAIDRTTIHDRRRQAAAAGMFGS